MKKFLVALVLGGVMAFASGNQWATASHSDYAFTLPHSVAIVLDKWDLVAGQAERFATPGCDLVLTAPMRDTEGMLFGYAIHAVIEKTRAERLVAVELYNLRGDLVYSYINRSDYDDLKMCHTTVERLDV